jgi:hypothetical protein
MDRDELTATRWMTSRLVVGALVIVGAWVMTRPEWLGYAWLAKKVGGDANVQAIGLGCAFFVLAAQSWEISKLRLRVAELIEELKGNTEGLRQLLYGKDYTRDREAIEILLTTLETASGEAAQIAHEHLCRLTGQNFAQDARVWRPWWEAHKKTFARAKGGDPPAK